MLETPGELHFDKNVLKIAVHHEPQPMPAPMLLHAFVPSRPQCESLLNRVLYDPASQEQRLLASLRPNVTHAEIRHPAVYSRMIDYTLPRLRKMLTSLTSADDQKKVRRAVETLEQFKSLFGTFRQYQHALHRG